MLYRSPHETDPSLWGIPAGKVDGKEDDLSTAVREVFEETNIQLDASVLKYLGELPIEYDSFTVVFPIFYAVFDHKPDVTLDPAEHIEYKWMTVKQILGLPSLMKDVDKIVVEFCVKKLGMSQK